MQGTIPKEPVLMTKLSISLVLAAAIFALSGALFFAAAGGRKAAPGYGTSSTSADEAAAALAAKVAGLADRLDRVESAFLALDRPPPAAAPAAPAETGAPAEESETAAEEGVRDTDERSLLASVLKGEGTGGLRNYIEKVIGDEREARRRRDLEQRAEREREFQELAQGPYGKFNFRVNSLAKTLGLSERQKEQYYALLSGYAARFEEARKNVNREDPEDLKSYRERKQAMAEEFETLVIQTLNPSQAEDYAALPDFEKSPDPKMAGEFIQLAMPPGDGPTLDAVFFKGEVMVGAAPAPVPAGAAPSPPSGLPPPAAGK